ncbi:hypothetical protein [Streptomyces sp. NPDC050704]|uniref:hypothetical protein n=1 Tax=Streptomyces sp. NPDC050704 TaxID=3157219 RepID=UPI0034426B62
MVLLRQGDLEGDVVAVRVQAGGELGGFEQASLQLFGGVCEMAGQVGEGVQKLGEVVGCLGRGGRAESSERAEGVDPLVFQVVVDVAEGGGVGVVGGAVLGLLQEIVLAAGDIVQ